MVSIHAPIRRATYLIPSFDVLYLFRSTPTVGRATGEWRIISHGHCFNPRPPCGGRHCRWNAWASSVRFQSTPPMRRATMRVWTFGAMNRSFNPRPPCGGRLSPDHRVIG